jgi:hypothetical protein
MGGFISRGFGGRRRAPEGLAERIPPGQYYERGFPVLTAGPTPRIAPDEWRLCIDGMVGRPREWSWERFHELGNCILFQLKDGRVTDGREHFHDLYAWDEFWS